MVFLLVGIWEHVNGHFLSTFVFVCLAVLLFCIGTFVAWLRKHKELEELKKAGSIPELFLQYLPNIPNALIYSGFFLRTANERKASNVKISSEDTVGDNHRKLGMKWESPGSPVGKDGVPVLVKCVYYKDGTPYTYSSVMGNQINLFFEHKRDNPRELVVTLEYTDVGGQACPPRRFKISQDVWNDGKISCEPVKN